MRTVNKVKKLTSHFPNTGVLDRMLVKGDRRLVHGSTQIKPNRKIGKTKFKRMTKLLLTIELKYVHQNLSIIFCCRCQSIKSYICFSHIAVSSRMIIPQKLTQKKVLTKTHARANPKWENGKRMNFSQVFI